MHECDDMPHRLDSQPTGAPTAYAGSMLSVTAQRNAWRELARLADAQIKNADPRARVTYIAEHAAFGNQQSATRNPQPATRDPRPATRDQREHRALNNQHSTIFTANPPRDVSLYFVFISAPVSRMVLMTESSDT